MNSGSEIGILDSAVLVSIAVIWVKMTPWKKRTALMLRWQRVNLRALCTLLVMHTQRATQENSRHSDHGFPSQGRISIGHPNSSRNSPATPRCAQQHLQHKQHLQLVAATRHADTSGWEPGLQMAHHHPSRRGNLTCQLLPDYHRYHGWHNHR